MPNGRYAPGANRENAPLFEAWTDETGWTWLIPLHNGATSVGIVLAEDQSKCKKDQHRSESNGKLVLEVQHGCYLADLERAPRLIQLLGPDTKFEGKLMSADGYSYHASEYAAPQFRIAGDAGGSSIFQIFLCSSIEYLVLY